MAIGARWLAWTLVLAGSLAIPAPAWADEALPLEPLYTLEHEFAIPFTVDTDPSATSPVGHAQLFVSSDEGKTWILFATEPAIDGNFIFRAPFEGEFWFIVRGSVTSQPPTLPPGQAPELRVVVGPKRAPQQVSANLPLGQTPEAIAARHVNSRIFELDYGDGAATESQRVELWWTGNGGASWQRYGTDDDCTSPMHVSVDADGVYGLWLVAADDQGQLEAPPQAGDTPQLWVAVDTQAPQAKLTAAEIVGTDVGHDLLLRWEASDAELSGDPIVLDYGPNPQGPWSAMGAIQGNPGEYHCRITDLGMPDLSMPMYFRLSALDAAGNSQTFITNEPVVLPEEVVAAAASQGPIAETARGTHWYQVLR